jgi:hypothetical protein
MRLSVVVALRGASLPLAGRESQLNGSLTLRSQLYLLKLWRAPTFRGLPSAGRASLLVFKGRLP